MSNTQLVEVLTCVLVCASLTTTTEASSCPASSAAPIALSLVNNTIASQGTGTTTYGVWFDVGNPTQNLCLTPSTVVDNTLLISANICNGTSLQNMTEAQCRSYHGGLLDVSTAGASFHNVSVASADVPADPGWQTFNPSYTVAGTTNIDLVSNVAIPNMTVIAITEGVNFAAGHIGLGKDSVILQILHNSGKIPSRGFGLNAGSQSIDNARRGNLVLGGYDSASVLGSFHNYAMNYSDTLAGRHCPLQVNIQGLQLVMDGQDPIQLIGPGDGHAACIEPYDNLFRLSDTGLRVFKQVTGWSAETSAGANGLYLPEPGLKYPATSGFNGSLRYVLSDGFTVEIPNDELQHPLRGLDGNGKYTLQSNVTEVNVYEQPLGAWVLGKVFLSRVYLAVDYEAQQLQLAGVNQNDVTPSPVRFDSATSGCNKATLSAGAIAAIVLGALICLASIAGIGYCLGRRRRRTRNQQKLHSQPEMQTDPFPVLEAHTPPANDEHRIQHDELERRDPELPGVGRTAELESPNGGHPPASPTEPRRVQPNTPSPVNGAQTHATQPWYERKYA